MGLEGSLQLHDDSEKLLGDIARFGLISTSERLHCLACMQVSAKTSTKLELWLADIGLNDMGITHITIPYVIGSACRTSGRLNGKKVSKKGPRPRPSPNLNPSVMVPGYQHSLLGFMAPGSRQV